MLEQKDPDSSPLESGVVHMCKQDGGAQVESKSGKDIPIQAIGQHSGVGPLSLGKKWSRPMAHSYVAEYGLKGCP